MATDRCNQAADWSVVASLTRVRFQSHVTEKKVEIPLGKPAKSPAQDTSLLYNEYIVYDVAQAHINYLLQVKFNFKY